jgi:putative acetyltransferase
MSDLLSLRPSIDSDRQCLIDWLMQPEVLHWFPLYDLREVEDAARIWFSYAKVGGVLTAVWDGVPCGSANLYLQPYKKLAHQCLFAIIVDEAHRGKGIGTRLLQALMDLAKLKFKIVTLHLEVYEGNPAIHLYQRLGFKEYGAQPHFIKDEGHYLTKIMMQKTL